MKSVHKNIAIAVIFLVIATTLGYTYYSKRNEKTAQPVKNEAIEKSSNIDGNIDGIKIDNTVEDKRSEQLKSLEPFSSNIVIYDSHSDEKYMTGEGVEFAASLLNNNLAKEGYRTRFIPCPVPAGYAQSYQSSREVITSKVVGYENTILLDIHRDSTSTGKVKARTITFVLDKSNPHFEDNNRLAQRLAEGVSKSSAIKAELYYYNNSSLHFNQDLSNKAVMIEIGNETSSQRDVMDCINALTFAIKNSQVVASK